jgi:hypothetical protein
MLDTYGPSYLGANYSLLNDAIAKPRQPQLWKIRERTNWYTYWDREPPRRSTSMAGRAVWKGSGPPKVLAFCSSLAAAHPTIWTTLGRQSSWRNARTSRWHSPHNVSTLPFTIRRSGGCHMHLNNCAGDGSCGRNERQWLNSRDDVAGRRREMGVHHIKREARRQRTVPGRADLWRRRLW